MYVKCVSKPCDLPKFVFAIDQYQPCLCCELLTAAEEAVGIRGASVPVLLSHQTVGDNFLCGDELVMFVAFGSGSQLDLIQLLVLN